MNLHKYENYLFDFDGTIVTLDVDWESLKNEIDSICSELNINSNQTLAKKINLLKPLVPQVFTIIKKYESQAKYEINKDTVAFIKNLPYFYIISNNLNSTISNILKEIDISHKCKQIIAIDDVNNSKPNPEAFNLINDKIVTTKCLYIGDKKSDKQFAENCKLNFKYVEEL